MEEMYINWMAHIPGLGAKKKIMLSHIFNGAIGVYKATQKELEEVAKQESEKGINRGGFTKADVESIVRNRHEWRMEDEWKKLKESGIQVTEYSAKTYPERLKTIPDPPYQLFFKGELPTKGYHIALIGARECSLYGERVARELGRALGEKNVGVISGLARGIDGIAEEAAVKAGGQSYAVLGCGVDICYPKQNIELYTSLHTNGGIISEYIPGTEPKARLFPPRNRIISGLSDAVVVIEAKEKSGTLITVSMALEQGRDVYAVPGRVTDYPSIGCNELIRQGAGIVLSPREFISDFLVDKIQLQIRNENVKEDTCIYDNNKNLTLNMLSNDEQEIYFILEDTPKSLDEISKQVNLRRIEQDKGRERISVPELLSILLEMQMKDVVGTMGVNHYFRLK